MKVPRLRAMLRTPLFLALVFAFAPALIAQPIASPSAPAPKIHSVKSAAIPAGDVRVHYYRPDNTYANWQLYTYGDTTVPTGGYCGTSEIPQSGVDSYGVYFDVPVNNSTNSGDLGFIINNCVTSAKDPGQDQALQTTQYNEAWVISGNQTVYTTAPSTGATTELVRIHYDRPDFAYNNWQIYTYGDTTTNTSGYCGSSEIPQAGNDTFGVYFDIVVDNSTNSGDLGFIINNCVLGTKDPGQDQALQTTQYNEAWVISGNQTVYTTDPNSSAGAETVRIHYYRPDNNYANWQLYTYGDTTINTSGYCGTSEISQSGVDSYGVYFDVPVNNATNGGDLGFIINNCVAGTKDPGPDQALQTTNYNQAWVVSGNTTVYTTQPATGATTELVRIHYHRPDSIYTNWQIYTYGDTTTNTSGYCGSSEIAQAGTDGFGEYFDIVVNNSVNSGYLGFIINNCVAGTKDPGPDQALQTTEYNEAWVISGNTTVYTTEPAIATGPESIRIHYHRFDNNYAGWALYTSGDTTVSPNVQCGSGEVTSDGSDSYGIYFDVVVNNSNGSPVGQLGFVINNCAAGTQDPGGTQYLQTTNYSQAWVISGDATVFTTQPAPALERIHYHRPDGIYTNWQVYTYNDATTNEDAYCGASEISPDGSDSYGIYFDVPVNNTSGSPQGGLGFIINNCVLGIKDPGPDQFVQSNLYPQVWVISGDTQVFTSQPTASQIVSAGLFTPQGYWLDRLHVLLPASAVQSGATYQFCYNKTGNIGVGSTGATNCTHLALTVGGTLTADELTRYPQLAGYQVLSLPSNLSGNRYHEIFQGQIGVVELNSSGAPVYATGLQYGGALDDLYYYSGPLGVIINGKSPFQPPGASSGATAPVQINLWAPTAQSVALQIYANEGDTTPAQTVTMTETNGVWSATGPSTWVGEYYLFSEVVYVPVSQQAVTNLTTDPWSIDLAINGAMSRITDLDAETNKPSGWDASTSPALASFNDMSIYELHIRDFSINDLTVPASDRGFYEAFADTGTDGMNHLQALAASGLKAVHILPSFHIGSVNEDKSTWVATPDLTVYPRTGTQQSAAVEAVQGNDAYNWGYDPVHYAAPAGNYAINPDNRVSEYRTMVQGIHGAGLRMIQDVVFNHTYVAGQGPNSSLDETVPNYYHRYDANGVIETASCCYDTAPEHKMFEKLEIDTILLNVQEYKVDGFRFDVMGFNFLYNMTDIKNALAALTPENSGIDGSKIYLYGEGFNFGDTLNGVIGPNADQINLYGYGIGTFNDRIRDGIRGGNSFTNSTLQEQGFATGLYTSDSAYTTSLGAGSSAEQTQLLQDSDWIRVGLTGNLRDYTFTDYTGATVTGAQVNYNGQPAGYTASPIEAINYCSVHDDQDFFDAMQVKASSTEAASHRKRRPVLAMSLLQLGQGVPFFQGGDDLLRSKDMDNGSYNSGDWYNKIDWTGNGNNWNIGLPIANVNQAQWPFEEPLLANLNYAPKPADIATTTELFQEFMKIRYSSGLFRMATEAEIQQNLTFLNVGTSQTPGLIVMKLDANGGSYGPYNHILVVFNATPTNATYTDAAIANMHYSLHPVQAASPDTDTAQSLYNETGTVRVRGLTTAVFVSTQP